MVAIIYIYYFDGYPIYVGQTRTTFAVRDRKHRHGNSLFDKHYRYNRARYTSRVLYQTNEYLSKSMLHRFEIYTIARYNTYWCGLNTPGGRMQNRREAHGHFKEKWDVWAAMIRSWVRGISEEYSILE